MFTVNAKALNTNLAFIKRAAGVTATRHHRVPVLRAIRIDVADGTATVGFFDYETSVQVRMPAEGSGSVAVDVAHLVDAIRTVGGKSDATFTVTDGKVRVDANGVSTTLDAVDGEDLPLMPELDAEPAIIAAGDVFAAATLVAASSVGKDDTLPMLTGVRFEGEAGGSATLASTDRFRLAVVDLPSACRIEHDFAALLPGKVLTEFGKASVKADSVSAAFGEGFAKLESESTTVVVKLLDAEFPKYRQLLPDPYDYAASFTVPAAATAKQFKAVAKARQVRLEIMDEVTASTESASFKVEAGEVSGDGMLVAFNPEYLAAILASAPAGVKATVNLTTPTRPAVIEWVGVRCLLMPVRLPG